VAAHAQELGMPVIGYLSSFPANVNPQFTQAFRQGLKDVGFFEGRNVTIEYRWDEEGRYERLPIMAADLVDRRVAVLFASPIPSSGSTRTAKSGRFPTSSWIRASNFTFPTMPTLRPKLRKVARRSFSIATAFDCRSLRCVSSIRSF
jgi:hypothetical protein